MKTKRFAILGLFTLLSFSAFAQNSDKKFGIEINGGTAFPVKEISSTKLNPGFGFETLFHYRFMSHLGAYAGWGWNKLSAENSFAGDDVCFEETGYVFGLQFMHPIGGFPFSYYLRGGGLYNHIETENAQGDIINDTGHGLGFQLAGGVSFNIGKNWSINPDDFFRINRKYIVHMNSITNMLAYSRSRVVLELKPAVDDKFDTIVSIDRSSDFKKWLNR